MANQESSTVYSAEQAGFSATPSSPPVPTSNNAMEEMRRLFLKRAGQLIEQDQQTTTPVLRVGLEVELFAVDNSGNPISSQAYTQVEGAEKELGASQVELATKPVVLNTLSDLENEVVRLQGKINQASNASRLIRLGAIPHVAIHDIVTTPGLGRVSVLQIFDGQRSPSVQTNLGGVNFDRAKCVGIFQSTQVNIQCDSLADAVDKLNRSLMISPYLVAVSGNARVVDRNDTGFNDIRMLAWERSYDLRSPSERKTKEHRVGTPSAYFRDIHDYFKRCSEQDFHYYEPAKAFELGIKTFWIDARIKFINDKTIVEYRAMPVQPSAAEDAAMSLFYFGRLAWSQKTDEELVRMGQVHRNRNAAMGRGLRGKLYSGSAFLDASTAVGLELDKAEKGLSLLGYKTEDFADYFAILRERIARKETPADRFVSELKRGIPLEENVLKYAV